MDYIDFHVRRIADDLRRAGVTVSGNVPAPTSTDEPQWETEFTIAQGHKSQIYLPHWIHDHRDDPALIVGLFVVALCPESSWTLLELGFHGPLAHPPS